MHRFCISARSRSATLMHAVHVCEGIAGYLASADLASRPRHQVLFVWKIRRGEGHRFRSVLERIRTTIPLLVGICHAVVAQTSHVCDRAYHPSSSRHPGYFSNPRLLAPTHNHHLLTLAPSSPPSPSYFFDVFRSLRLFYA